MYLLFKKVTTSLLLLFFVLEPSIIQAQKIRFTNIGIKDGLSNYGVRAITQDSQGNIWFGTEIGLTRYDGYSFRIYNTDSKDPNALPDSYIRDLLIDYSGNLWIATGWGGVAKYNQDSDNFEVFKSDKNDEKSIPSDIIYSLALSNEGNIWVGTRNGIALISPDSGGVRRLDENTLQGYELADKRVISLKETSRGDLWIGTIAGLAYYSKSQNKIIQIELGQTTPRVRDFEIDKEGSVFLATNQGVYKIASFDHQNLTIQKQELIFDRVKNASRLLIDHEGTLWIGTLNGGLFRYTQSSLVHYPQDNSDAGSLSDDAVISIFQDHSNIIWVGSYSNGVDFFNPNSYYFGNLDGSKTGVQCLPSSYVFASYYDEQRHSIFFGTDNGLAEYDLANQSCLLFQHKKDVEQTLSHKTIYSIYKYDEKRYWIGTSSGIDLLDYDTRSVTRMGHLVDNENITQIVKVRDWLLLITFSGIYKFNHKTYEVEKLKLKESGEQNFNVSKIVLGNGDDIWVASNKGLLHINKANFEYSVVKVSGKPLIEHQLRGILFDGEENLYLTADKQGVLLFNTRTKTVENYGDKFGLQHKEVLSGLYQDSEKNLWISSYSDGLTKIDVTAKSSQNFRVVDGLYNESFTQNSFSKLDGERVLLGGNNGFNIFNPANLKFEQKPPIVKFDGFTLFGKPVNPGSDYDGFKIDQQITNLSQLNLSYKEYLFGIDFSASHYIEPRAIEYAYRLDGLSNDWTYSNASRRGATYSNLSPGEYTFRLKAKAEKSSWSPEKTLKITVHPAPWATWWAYTIYAITFIIALFTFIRKRTQILEARAKQLQDTVDERTAELVDEKSKVEKLLSRKNEEFANVSHEFRTPLTLILGPAQQLEKQPDQKTVSNKVEVIKRNAYRLLRMVDQLLHMETFRVKAITQKTVQDFKTVISLISESFVDLAEVQGIQLNVKNIDKVYFEFTPDALEKIILNLLSNALKYTNTGGNISISAQRENECFVIRVKDTGIGIPEDKLATVFDRFQRVLDENSEKVTGAGIGLALVKELVESHQGNIELNSKVGLGTEVKVTLPIIGEVEELQEDYQTNEEIIALELMSFAAQNQDQTGQVQSAISEERYDSNILVIEDNDDMRNYIVENLQDHYNVITAPDGEAGFKLAEEQIPDIIISDVMMPKMDGYQVTKSLRSSQNTSHIPIILLTARGDRESRMKGWYEKADEYLTKPFDVEELLIRVQNLLDIRELVQKKFGETLFVEEQPVTQTVHSVEGEQPQENKVENEFLDKLNTNIEKCYQDPDTKIDIIASQMAMSQRQLLRKLKGLLDMTPVEYLRRYRLDKSRTLLLQGAPITNIALDVGFASVSHFGKCFKAQYGCSPSEFTESLK